MPDEPNVTAGCLWLVAFTLVAVIAVAALVEVVR